MTRSSSAAGTDERTRPETAAEQSPPPAEHPRPRTPAPGSAEERLHQLYMEYIGWFPVGGTYTPDDWADTWEKEGALDRLFQETRRYCEKSIRSLLIKNGLWPNDLDTETQTVFHDAFVKVLKALCKYRSGDKAVNNYAAFAVRICRRQCIDYLKVRHPGSPNEVTPVRRRDYVSKEGSAPGGSGRQGKKTGEVVYVDPYRRGETGPELDMTVFSGEGDSVATVLERRMDLKGSRKILYLYVKELLNYQGSPEKALGLCYGRVLYQVICRSRPAFDEAQSWEERREPDDDRGSKEPAVATSPVWAMRRMTGRTFAELCAESEGKLSWYFGLPLRWGEPVRRQLEQPRTLDGESRLLADLRYDRVCTLAQVRGWCTTVHKSLLSRVFQQVMQDEALADFCEEYLPASSAKFLGKGAQR